MHEVKLKRVNVEDANLIINSCLGKGCHNRFSDFEDFLNSSQVKICDYHNDFLLDCINL